MIHYELTQEITESSVMIVLALDIPFLPEPANRDPLVISILSISVFPPCLRASLVNVLQVA